MSKRWRGNSLPECTGRAQRPEAHESAHPQHGGMTDVAVRLRHRQADVRAGSRVLPRLLQPARRHACVMSGPRHGVVWHSSKGCSSASLPLKLQPGWHTQKRVQQSAENLKGASAEVAAIAMLRSCTPASKRVRSCDTNTQSPVFVLLLSLGRNECFPERTLRVFSGS